MSEKYYLKPEDIKVISEAIKMLRSEDFNQIHDNLAMLSGLNMNDQIEAGRLLSSVQALQAQLTQRAKSVKQEMVSNNKNATLNRYHSQLQKAASSLNVTTAQMEKAIKPSSVRKLDGSNLFGSVRNSMNAQFARLSKPSADGGSIEIPDRMMKMFMQAGKSMIQDHANKGIFNDSRNYKHAPLSSQIAKSPEEMLYRAISSGNFAELENMAKAPTQSDYNKIAAELMSQFESGLGKDASAFKKDLALTNFARNLNMKPLMDFKGAFTKSALNGGEKIAAEIKNNIESFMIDNLTTERYEQAMGEMAGLFSFADGDTESRDRAISKAADIADKYVSNDVKEIFKSMPKNNQGMRQLKSSKIRQQAVRNAVDTVKSSVINANDRISQSQSFLSQDKNGWFSGKNIQDRYNTLKQTSRGKGAAGYNVKSYASESLDRIQNAAARAGLSLIPSISDDGSLLHLGFIPKSMESSVMGKDGKVDFGKASGHVSIPMGTKSGSMKVHGISKADFFTSLLDNDTGDFVGTTMSDANFKLFADALDRMKLSNLSPSELKSKLGRAYQDIYGESTGLNQYVDSDEMLKGTTLGDNAAANFNKASGFNSKVLIDSLKKNSHIKSATKDLDQTTVDSTLHDLITAAGSGSDTDYESFIKSTGWLNNLYGSQGTPGAMRSVLSNLRTRMQPYRLTSSDRRDDPYNAGIYSTSASHVFKPFMKEYGSGAGGRYGEQSLKDIARTTSANDNFTDLLNKGGRGLSTNRITDGVAKSLGLTYRDGQLYNMLPVSDADLAQAHIVDLRRSGHAPSVFGGGLALRSSLYDTLEAQRAIPTDVSQEDLLSSGIMDLFTDEDFKRLQEMKDGDYLSNAISSQKLTKNYRVGNSLLKAGIQLKGIKYNNGKYTLDAMETISAAEGEKYLTGLGLRGTLAPGDVGVDDELIAKVLSNKGYTPEQVSQLTPQISGFISSEDLTKTKYQSGNLLGKIQYALNGALANGMTEAQFTKKMASMSKKGGTLGQALSQYFSYQDGNIVTSTDRDFTEILSQITGGDVAQIQAAEKMLFNPDVNTKGSLPELLSSFVGKTSPLALGLQAGLLSTSLNKADTATYNDVSSNEKYSRVKAGARERDIMRRTGRNIASGAGVQADNINAYFNAIDEMMTPEAIEKADAEIARMKKISNSTMASGTQGQIKGDTYLSDSDSSRAILDIDSLTNEEKNLALNKRSKARSDSSYTMTADEFNSSIFGHMSRLREQIYGAGGITDINSIPMSAKLAGRVDMGDGYGVSELFLSSLPKQITNPDGTLSYQLSQEQIAFERAIKQSYHDKDGKNISKTKENVEGVLQAQNSEYMNKGGSLFKQRNERVQAGAGFLQASAGNVTQGNENAWMSNSVEISMADAKTMLSGLDPDTFKFLQNSIAQKGVKGTAKDGSLTLDDVVSYYADANNSDYLIGEAKRFPLKGDNTIAPTRVRINKDLQSGTMRMHSGIAANLKADFDGDLPALSLSAYRKQYGSQQEFDQVMSGGRASIEALDSVVQAVGRYNTVKGAKTKSADEFAEEYMQTLTSTDDKEALGDFSKKLKTSLGLHSAAFSGQNYVADSSIKGNPEAQMRQMLLNSVFSSIEQDMLSNKKLEELANSNNNLSLAENARQQSAHLGKINQALYNKDTTIDQMVSMWQDAGFIGEQGISNQFTLDSILKVSKFFGKDGNAFLQSLGINPDVAYNATNVADSDPLITTDTFKSLYKAQFGTSKFGQHSSAYREAIGRTVTHENAVRDAKYGANIYGITNTDDTVNNTQAVDMVKQLATVLGTLTGNAGGATEALQNAGRIEITGYNNGGKAISTVASQVYGNEYAPDATESAISNQINAMLKAGSVGARQQAIEQLGNMQLAQGDQWGVYRGRIQHTRYGTMQHAALEALLGTEADLNGMAGSNAIKSYLSSKGIDLSSITGLESFINTPVGSDASADVETFRQKALARWSSYQNESNVYRDVMTTALGYDSDRVDSDLSGIAARAAKTVSALRDMGIDMVAVEESVAASIDGQNVRGRADIIGRNRNTGEEVIVDAKNTGKVSNAAVAQTGLYASIANAARQELTDAILTSTGKASKSEVTDEELQTEIARLTSPNGDARFKGMTPARLQSLFRTDSTSSGVLQLDNNDMLQYYSNAVGGQALLAMVSKAMSGNLTTEDIANNQKFLGTKAALARTYSSGMSGLVGAESSTDAPAGYTPIDELSSVRTVKQLNNAFTAYGESIGRDFSGIMSNTYDPTINTTGLFSKFASDEAERFSQIEKTYGRDGRGIKWSSQKGTLRDDQIVSDKAFAKQYQQGLKDGSVSPTATIYDELAKISPDTMPSISDVAQLMPIRSRINAAIDMVAPLGHDYSGIRVGKDGGLEALMKREAPGVQSSYDMIRDSYEEAIASGQAKPGILPTEDEIYSFMKTGRSPGRTSPELLKLQESMNQYGTLMNESMLTALNPQEIMQLTDSLSAITALRQTFAAMDPSNADATTAQRMFSQFDTMGASAAIGGDVTQMMYGTISKDFSKQSNVEALKGHINTLATLKNKQLLGEQLTDDEVSQVFDAQNAIKTAQTNISNGSLAGNELSATRELLIVWNQIRQAVEGVKGQVSEYTTLTNQALGVDQQIYAIKAKIATEGRSATQAEQDRLSELQKQRAEIESQRAGMKKDASPEFLQSVKNVDTKYGVSQAEAQERATAQAPMLIEKENQEILKQQKQAMKSGIGSQTAYDNAELNMLRAQKALEAAQKSGNQQQIDAAQQQLEGARAQAGIASQYKPSFTMNEDGTGTLKTFDQETQQWKETNLAREQALKYQNDLNLQTAKHQQAVGKVHAPVKTLGSLVGEVLGGIKQTTAYLMRTSLVYGIIGKVKQAFSDLVQAVKALNKSYVDLRIASGQTDSQMKDTMKIYSQMASEMGKTTQEVAAAANDWLRAGYNAEESAKLIKNSMQLSTVGMIDSAKATEYLISTMKGWKLGVDDMEGVIDKMSELDRNAAISSGDIAEAMSRANVSAQLAGSELNKYMSYITTVSDVSQMSAETVGTA